MILNWMPNKAMIPKIHNQLTAMGRNDNSANGRLRNEAHRKKNTMQAQAQPM